MDKYKKIQQILILTLLFNWLVAFAKFIYGIITRSAAMTADGVHSFGDGASNIIGLIGIWAASKPEDKEHPYGHGKFETIATLGIVAVLFIASFDIIRDAFLRILHPVVPDVTAFSFALMFATMAINISVMRYERKRGQELSSDILICDALHTRSDIFASLTVLATLVSIKLGFSFVDIIVAVLIAILIAKSGLDILKRSSNVLCDGSVVSEARIANIVSKIAGVQSVHKIRTRGREDAVHMDLHVIIDADTHVDDAHALSHKISSIIKEKIQGVKDVIVHIEPNK